MTAGSACNTLSMPLLGESKPKVSNTRGQRIIFFTGGKATGSNATAKLVATKNDDITTVRIGAAEIYYIPDALVFGG